MHSTYRQIAVSSLVGLFLTASTAFCAPVPSTLRADGTILVDGKPFFPFGFYSRWNYSHAERLYEIKKLGDAGFNAYWGEANNCTLDEYDRLLDSADRHKIKIFTKHFTLNGSETDMSLVNRFKQKPAVLGWGIADDAQVHYTAAQVATMHTNVKAADPGHITYISCTGAILQDLTSLDQFSAASDVTAIQWYPVTNTDLRWTYDAIRKLAESARKSGHASIANLQTYVAVSRYPTADEIDIMTYMAVIAGVKGILHYTFEDGASSIDRTQPDLWARCVQDNREIQSLATVLLDGTRTVPVADNGKSLYAGCWKYQNEVCVVAVNASTGSQTMTITVPAISNGRLENPFTYRPGTMVLTGTTLSGTIGAYSVHLYRISNGSTGTHPLSPRVRDGAMRNKGITLSVAGDKNSAAGVRIQTGKNSFVSLTGKALKHTKGNP